MTGERLGALARRYWFDALIVAGVGVGIYETTSRQNEPNGPRGPLWFDVLAILATVLPLFARRRWPFAAPMVTGIAIGASSFVDRAFMHQLIPPLAGFVAAFLVAMVRDRSQAIAGLAIGVGVIAVSAHNDPTGGAGNFVFVSIVFALVWTVGFAIGRKFQEADEARERAARAEREREERARLAVSDERARIARELHDVVGHSVSVMTVQASGVRRLLRDDQEREREALLIVERTGREALAEMRRMVGVLRRPEEAPALAPQPSLEHLERLVEQARDAGLPVDLRVEGEARPGGTDECPETCACDPGGGARELQRRSDRGDGQRRRPRRGQRRRWWTRPGRDA